VLVLRLLLVLEPMILSASLFFWGLDRKWFSGLRFASVAFLVAGVIMGAWYCYCGVPWTALFELGG
jgi:hypothetical protein